MRVLCDLTANFKNPSSWVLLSATLVLLFLSLTPVAAAAPGQENSSPDSFKWLAKDGTPLPFTSREEMEEFLRTAEVVSMRELSTGITRPDKVLLEKDGIRMSAVFRTVNYSKRKWNSSRGPRLNFRDKYIFEVAAYELGKLLGLENIPPTVLRKIDGKEGSLQAWVENAMTEEMRINDNVSPPDRRRWIFQINIIRVFDNLVFNDDRNQGNILIGPDWKVWMIDATRCFQMVPELKKPEDVQYCERGFWQRLNELTEEQIETALKETGLLSPGEIRTLLVRRDKLIKHINSLIEEKGEAAVLLSL